MKNFQQKIVVITGAGSGMGRAYAQEFARLGAKLALNDYDAMSLAETVKMVGDDCETYAQAFDVADDQAMQRFAGQVEQQLGKAHVVINNAGIEGAQKPAWVMPAEDYQRTMAVNFDGVVNGSRAFLPQLLANDEGALVNVSSIFGLIGTPNNTDYCASKFAVRGYTEALMVELQHSHVKAYLLHPGGIATNIVKSQQGQEFGQHFLTTPPEAVAKHVVKALGRGGLRIVYGQSAFRTWLGAIFLPLRLLNRLIWRELKPLTDLSHYPHGK